MSTRTLSVAEVDALGERFRPWRTLAAVYHLTVTSVPHSDVSLAYALRAVR